ncbi:hypothetical protein HPB52_001856 [Rhipicephalus sanguineus]|uniref:Uncharacterized protein n=1 Tax=Rhipicephalus sanguineus TaxID=34632 RepID=A0A9D4PKD1_RHISA|nr:hypothetical protein HPB52_001856 [Rhipicephalus sanguineus]
MTALKMKYKLVKEVLLEARSRLSRITNSEGKYKALLERLNLQGLYQLLEGDVLVRCRQTDVQFVKEALVTASKVFTQTTGISGSAVVDLSNFLGDSCCGGVIITSRNGQKSVSNTLEDRLERISYYEMPYIQATLFRKNQGLYQLLEGDVLVRCRQTDVRLVKEALVTASKVFTQTTGISGSAVMDLSNFLGDSCCGGVIITSRNGQKSVSNTLEDRLERISYYEMPYIQATLFRKNQVKN